MKCPVCNEKELTGRQRICGTKCRSAKYRKAKEKRDTSQDDAEAGTTATRSLSRQRHGSRGSDMKQWEQLISVATERVIEAMQRHGTPSASLPTDGERVDMQEQVASQAPTLAVGYRLVLPGRSVDDVPRFSPRRSRTREVAWYSLAPFEYPDDIRLYHGAWYRIVWVDAQGRRIRMRPGEPVPGLCYFVGPTRHGRHDAPPGSASSPARQSVEVEQAPPASKADPPLVETEQAASSPAPALVAPPAPKLSTPQVVSSSSSGEASMDALVREFLLAANLDLGRTAGSGGPVSLAVVLPPPPTTAPPESWTQMLAAFPPLTSEESMMLIDFVSHPELMMQIRYEQQLAEAKANGRPLPREPTTMLGHEPRQHLHALFTGELIPSHFWPRCRAIFDYVRQHGTDVLAHLPVPVPPLPATEQQWIEEALRSPPKRTYMHYVCARQDALLSGLPVPIEPSVSLSSKERNQIRRTMQDTRAVMFFRKRSASSNS